MKKLALVFATVLFLSLATTSCTPESINDDEQQEQLIDKDKVQTPDDRD